MICRYWTKDNTYDKITKLQLTVNPGVEVDFEYIFGNLIVQIRDYSPDSHGCVNLMIEPSLLKNASYDNDYRDIILNKLSETQLPSEAIEHIMHFADYYSSFFEFKI